MSFFDVSIQVRVSANSADEAKKIVLLTTNLIAELGIVEGVSHLDTWEVEDGGTVVVPGAMGISPVPLQVLYKLWEKFGDVPTDDDACINGKFLNFSVGTHREEIWHWFEEQNPQFVCGEVLMGVRRDHSQEESAQIKQHFKAFFASQGLEANLSPDMKSLADVYPCEWAESCAEFASEHPQPMSDEAYVNAAGGKCPYCGSDDISSEGRLEADGAEAWQEVRCGSCRATWEEVFRLVGYSNRITR